MPLKSLLGASLALLLAVGVSAEDAGTCPQEEVCLIPCPAENPTPAIGELQMHWFGTHFRPDALGLTSHSSRQ